MIGCRCTFYGKLSGGEFIRNGEKERRAVTGINGGRQTNSKLSFAAFIAQEIPKGKGSPESLGEPIAVG
jgi:hypothetical protein